MTKNNTQDFIFNRVYARPNFFGIVTFFVLLLISIYIALLSFQNEKKKQQRELRNKIEVIQQSINKSLDNSELAAFSLALTINKEGDPENFEEVASEIIKTYSTIDAVQLVPNGVIKYVYPYEPNKTVINYNILTDSTRNKEALKAIRLREMVFAGPFELKQGGVAIVGRLPIFIEKKFWGFSAVIIRLESLLENAGLHANSDKDYHFQFSKINPLTAKIEYFLPKEENLSLENAEAAFIPQGEWTLHILPLKIAKPFYNIYFIFAFGILFALFCALFIRNILKKPAELQNLVNIQSKEISKSGERNQAILRAFPDMLFIFDANGIFTYYQNSHNIPLLHPPEFFLGKKIIDVMPPEFAKTAMENIERVITSGSFVLHNYQLNISDKTEYFEARYARISETEVLVIIRNVTIQKTNEEEILKANHKLRSLSDHLQNVREEERALLSRELHDELGQQLTAISLDLHWLRKMTDGTNEKYLLKIDDALAIVQDSVSTVKRINTELRPAILDDLGLFAAVEWQLRDFSQRHEIETTFQCVCGHIEISNSRSIAIFRIIQESLNNIAKHAQASHVSLHGSESENELIIAIKDNGIGFNEKEISYNISFGLLGMRERANMLNGQIQIHSEKGNGTMVKIILPKSHLFEKLSNRYNFEAVDEIFS